ncbi:MAG: DUF3299 domain-containing protein [Verrucomicrobiae bacterium]|nr:DUF3299 domain-containing protein [Verrucomicrobiae bacterium]
MNPQRRKRLIKRLIVLGLVLLIGAGYSLRFAIRVAPAYLRKSGTSLVKIDPRAPPPPPLGDVRKVKFETLGGWKFFEGKTPIPPEVRELDGKTIEISGIMMSMNEVENVRHFAVVQSLWSCCFGQTPAPNHLVLVEMEPGYTSRYYPEKVRVIGKLSVGEVRQGDTLVAIYRMKAREVLVK